MVKLTEKQISALAITQAALVEIRRLARQPVSASTMAAIHDLADSLHNVPHGVTRRPESLALSRMFDEELDRDIEAAAAVFSRERLPLSTFPPETRIPVSAASAYIASGARFRVQPPAAGESAQAPRKRTGRRQGMGSRLARIIRIFFG
ncbi:hypothetical protein BED46_027800 [Burkholderia contaminans]|jgi:hypothetical protein|uniref:Uncharacterized protein n=2 Tax=Burkholderia contaminans TaxID=488447 RepID=A0A250LL23_9BURK|nr:hypothetical protein WR31_25675 [Burkholderia contaminans LMG 23361]MBA9841937.1 hypothetical protein [Burkholderia contaminans]MBA9866909.1 hypothetical protein [Burkholderia contaminans]MBA9933303.1 hypothetical protein [Burkholderia contaminans]MCB4330926.1 hypothetical protein [Burkholderia contaminans]